MIKYFSILFLFIFACISAQTVYTTPSGTKYHLASCRMVKNVSKANTVEKAQRSGFSPCSICRPPFHSALGISGGTKKTHGTDAKNRCKGTTKKGTRCRHYTSIGNDYCYQHLK